MTLVDTSAWIEYLRSTGSAAHHELRRRIDAEADLRTTELIVMEVLAGGRDDVEVRKLRRLLGRFDLVPVQGLADFEAAAELFRTCRRAGETIRALNDCLIAAIAIRSDLPVLQNDRDYEALARHTPLQLASVP